MFISVSYTHLVADCRSNFVCFGTGLLFLSEIQFFFFNRCAGNVFYPQFQPVSYTHLYFMTLNGKNLGQIEDDLNAEVWGMKKLIASKLKLRYTPDLNFRMDTSFAEVDRIEKLLRDPKVEQDLKKE